MACSAYRATGDASAYPNRNYQPDSDSNGYIVLYADSNGNRNRNANRYNRALIEQSWRL